MSLPWHPGWPPGQMIPDATTILEGTSFCISDLNGNIDGVPGRDSDDRRHGLFVTGLRVLDRWRLRVAEAGAEAGSPGFTTRPLTAHHSSPHAVLLVGHVHVDGARLLVERERYVGDGLLETIRIRNTSPRPTSLEVSLDVGADFAPAAAVRAGSWSGGTGTITATTVPASDVHGTGLRLTDAAGRSVTVQCAPSDCTPIVSGSTLTWSVALAGHAGWSTELQVLPRLDDTEQPPHHVPGAPPAETAPVRRRSGRRRAPRLATASPQLAAALTRSLEDLALLRVFDPEHPRLPLVAAGAPWAMVPLSRDSLLTATMLLPVDPHLALGTLNFLAAHQGRGGDPGSERAGHIPARPAGPGASVDEAPGPPDPRDASTETTALFVTTVGALHRWHPQLVSRELLRAAELGLQCLADGADAALAGEMSGPVERQAYTYAAFRAGAELASADGEAAAVDRWHEYAAQTRRRFDKRYWLPDAGHYAAAVDDDGQVDDRMTAMLGHCLWAGIVDETHAPRVVRALLSPELSSGWGLRSSATSSAGHDPFDLRHGAVWPHDTALAVAGLTRYGFCDEAVTLATTLVDLATACGGRVPSIVVGVGRQDVPVPLPHPAGCAPAAVAAAAPVEVLRALLRAEPGADGLQVQPCAPNEYLPLQLQGVRCAGATYDIAVAEDGAQVVRRD